MPATITPIGGPEAPVSTREELLTIEEEVKRQGAAARQAQQGFAIFALMALLIAAANLIVVATKLEGKSSTAAAPTTAAPAAAAPHTIGASLKEFSIIPTSAQAAAGRVTFRVRNGGTATHEFVVLRTNTPAGKLPITNGRADETGNVGETGDLAPGASKAITLSLKAGHYALICNLPGHYRAGQYSDLTVR